MYYLESKTTHYGSFVDILYKISFDIGTNETTLEKKIIGRTVVKCLTGVIANDHAEEIYQQELKDGWVVSTAKKFDEHKCTSREPMQII